jgi:hypothetical protein
VLIVCWTTPSTLASGGVVTMLLEITSLTRTFPRACGCYKESDPVAVPLIWISA